MARDDLRLLCSARRLDAHGICVWSPGTHCPASPLVAVPGGACDPGPAAKSKKLSRELCAKPGAVEPPATHPRHRRCGSLYRLNQMVTARQTLPDRIEK